MNRDVSKALAAAGLLLAAALPAAAHPHVWVKAKSEVVFDAKGRMTAVRHIWRFDDAYSAFASQGLDANGDGKLSVEELAPLAKINVESLKDFGYFTFLMNNGKDIDFGEPTEYWVQSDNGFLTLYFTLPTKEPVPIHDKPANLDVYDPTYFVSFTFVDDDPVTFDGAPAGCKADVVRPRDLDPATAATLAAIPAEQRAISQELMNVTEDLINGATLTCP